jgi:hypothetical protein
VAEALSAVRDQHGEASAVLREAAYSERELDAEATRVSMMQDTSTGRAYHFVAYPEDDASGVALEVEPGSDLLDMSSMELTQKLGAAVPLRAVPVEGASEGLVFMTGDSVPTRTDSPRSPSASD